jgi:hypothetical protein
MRKFALLVGLAGVIVLAGTAWAMPGGWVKYRARHLSFPFSFSHPTEWKARYAGYIWPPYGTPQYLIVALSTEHLHRPQIQCVQGPDNTTRCGPDAPILDTLPPDGVFIEWWLDASAFYGPQLTGIPGNPTHVGGAFAKIVIDPTGKTAGGICPKNTTDSVKLYIAGTAQPGSGLGRPLVYMYACTNTANFPRFMSQLLPIVRSVQVGPSKSR